MGRKKMVKAVLYETQYANEMNAYIIRCKLYLATQRSLLASCDNGAVKWHSELFVRLVFAMTLQAGI